MDIDAAQARCLQHGRWQNQAIGGDNRHIGGQGGKSGVFGRIAPHPSGGAHRQAQFQGCQMHRAWRLPLAAMGRLGRLRIDADDLMRGMQRPQGGDGEFGTAHENDTHGGLSAYSPILSKAPANRRAGFAA